MYTTLSILDLNSNQPTMSYYPKGHHFNPNDDEDVDDFDEHDPTPYGGGYDIALTFGRPLPPSDEICYRPSSSTSSGSMGASRPSYGDGKRKDDEPTPGYGRRQEHGSEYGSGGYGSEYGSGHPRRNETDESYGGGRKTYGHSDHTYRRNDDDDDGDGDGNKRPTYGMRKDDDDDDDGNRRNMYRRRNDDDDDDVSRRNMYRRNDDDGDDDDDGRRGRYGRRNDDDGDDGRKPRYGRRNDDDDNDGYRSRRNYGDDDDDDRRRSRY